MNKYQKKALGSSYFFLVFGITLVLFILGFWGCLVLGYKVFSENIRENFTITVSIKNQVSSQQTNNLISSLKKYKEIANVKFVDKETSAKELREDLGEDFINFLGYNPLFDIIEINLKSEYANPKHAESISEKIKKNDIIKDISYSKDLISDIYRNFRYINWTLFGISLFFIIVSSMLINSYIRLSVYSKRHIIMTMYLVGATRFFIGLPFIKKMLKLSFISAFFAVFLLYLMVYYLFVNIPFIFDKELIILLSSIGIGLFVVSGVITSLSTYLAVRNFLKLSR